MQHEVEHNALLLQVMSHDLLAPLTAIKWQVELLGRDNVPPAKRASYLEGITDSAALGITLTKHAHVAGQVLVGSYAQNDEKFNVPRLIRNAVNALALQYERHGVAIQVDISNEPAERTLDRELMSLLVWCIAKFFLTCTPANGTVSMRGVAGQDFEGRPMYTLIATAPDVLDRDEVATRFTQLEARDPYDQTYVFSKLIQTIAPKLGVSVTASTQANLLALEVLFGGKA